VSDRVNFKHWYIINPMVSPKSHIVAAAQQLMQAIKGNILARNETATALTKVIKLFSKIAATKQAVAQTLTERNILWSSLAARKTNHLPRMAVS
jgi:hypothetical protein